MKHLRARPAKWWTDCKDYPEDWKEPVDGQMEMFDDDGQDMAGHPGSAPVSGGGSPPSA